MMVGQYTGIVVCGGRSSRMGEDKSLITYHHLPQRYHAAQLLQPYCDPVFLSLNDSQEDKPGLYPVLTDAEGLQDTGPMAALLTAAQQLPGRSFLVLGCDYPLLDAGHLASFVASIVPEAPASAFYNKAVGLYEPLLACYTDKGIALLLQYYAQGGRSLQQWLQQVNAGRYLPQDMDCILSVDDPAMAARVKVQLRQRKNDDN